MVYIGIHISRHLKEELAWAMNKRLSIINNVMLLKIYTTNKLKNKAVFKSFNNILCVATWSLVTYCNCLVIYYQLCIIVPLLRHVLCLYLLNILSELHYKRIRIIHGTMYVYLHHQVFRY